MVFYGVDSDGEYYLDYFEDYLPNVEEDISWWIIPGTEIDDND